MSIYNPTMIRGVIAVLFTAIFLLDVLTPLGLPLSVFYIIPLALTSLVRRREAPYWLAGASSAATLCGYVLSPSLSGVPSWLPVINRGMCLALFWITAVLMRAHLVKEQDRKRIEELQGRLAAIVASSSDAIVSASLDGTVRTWNEGAQRMFGYGTDEMVGRSIHTIISSDRHAEETELFQRMANGERIEEYETIRIKKDGTALDVSLTVSPVRDPQGSIIGVAKIVRDITERKKSETVLINKNKDLETLLYVTSHDLKEPLRAIESFSQLVLERYADRIDASGGDYLRRIVRATRRLDRLLNDILELSRAQRMLPPMEEVEAEALVKEALTRLDSRIQETGAVVQIISPLPRLCVNRTWATQGLYNLLANAMKFTRDGHAPDIEIAPYEVPASATPFAGVVVKDRGPGVPTRQAERIFMLFQRAVGRDMEGTGAGLAIVHQVAERHGGRAWVQARAGGGSEFVMTFARPTHKNNGGASPT